MIKILAKMMTTLFSVSISVQLLLIVLVIGLPAAGMIVYSGVRLRNEAVNVAILDSQRLADSMALQQHNLVIAAQQLVSALAQFPEVKTRDAAKVEPLLKSILKQNSQYSNLALVDKTGLVWASAVWTKPPFIVADRRYFRNSIEKGQLSSGE